jgi:hypothetical protein
MKLLKQAFLIRYIALPNAEILQLKKKLLKGISFLELAAEREKLENAKHAIKTYQFITMTQYAANA